MAWAVSGLGSPRGDRPKPRALDAPQNTIPRATRGGRRLDESGHYVMPIAAPRPLCDC
jgi:hypothetical protein